MSLSSQPSNFSDEIDFIEGIIDIGDGFYSTNDYRKYEIFGFFFSFIYLFICF